MTYFRGKSMLMGFLIRQWLLRSGFTEFSAPAGNSSRILWWAPIINPLHCGKEGFRHTKNCTLNYKPQIYVGFSVMTFGHPLLATVRTKGSIKEPIMWSFNQVVDIIWLWTVLRDYYWGLPRHAGWVGLNDGCMLLRLDNTKVEVWLNVWLKAIWQEIINQYLLAKGNSKEPFAAQRLKRILSNECAWHVVPGFVEGSCYDEEGFCRKHH